MSVYQLETSGEAFTFGVMIGTTQRHIYRPDFVYAKVRFCSKIFSDNIKYLKNILFHEMYVLKIIGHVIFCFKLFTLTLKDPFCH